MCAVGWSRKVLKGQARAKISPQELGTGSRWGANDQGWDSGEDRVRGGSHAWKVLGSWLMVRDWSWRSRGNMVSRM